ncbi:MAG: peptidase MA family metallohydrolase, partial [Candidatus Omnitrophica bacterium]|nr:peptidase MA family metallohydrolase [Candidatus Omnitrophota bacterium]
AILPHEMGHIIFREFIGFDKDAVPLWLDEGIACSQEANIEERLKIAKFLINLNLYVPLENFSNLNKADLIMPFIFYSEAASVTNFILEAFGRDIFVNFCRRLRDNSEMGWKEVFLSVYKLRDLEELEAKWIDYCK